MQVLDYHTQPIVNQRAATLNSAQVIGLNEAIHQAPVNQLINSTINAINQTLQQMVQNAQQQKAAENSLVSHTFQDDWNFLYFIRLLFYILVIFKIIELVFSKRKKMDIKERVYRKYVFSYSEMIRQFNEEDRNIMNTTLKNTIKNASIDKNQPKMPKKTSNKRVIFHETKNEYIEPPKSEIIQEDPLSALQMFLSRPVKINPIDQQVPEEVEPMDKDFGQVEKIEEGRKMVRQEGETDVDFEKDEESNITQPINTGTIIRYKSELRENVESQQENQNREKDL